MNRLYCADFPLGVWSPLCSVPLTRFEVSAKRTGDPVHTTYVRDVCRRAACHFKPHTDPWASPGSAQLTLCGFLRLAAAGRLPQQASSRGKEAGQLLQRARGRPGPGAAGSRPVGADRGVDHLAPVLRHWPGGGMRH